MSGLTITRERNQKVYITNEQNPSEPPIIIDYRVNNQRDQLKMVFQAPPHYKIYREEIYNNLDKESDHD